MHALPALTLIATNAVRRQFAPAPEPRPQRSSTSRSRLALAALLDRAARAVAPAEHIPVH
jgi:hypothetical protein